MKRATITETKNGLSRLLDEVRRGETILITERKVPVARIEPVRGSPGTKDDRLAVLIGEGIVSPRSALSTCPPSVRSLFRNW